ncbi:MAG: T9SS type A sorting domain-containing protein, partial [candidate division Zixibacteria bacterium]
SDGEITRGGEIAIDPSGNVFISDRYQGIVAVFSSDGDFIDNINLGELNRSNLSLPTGLAVDNQGFVYVSTTEGRRIEIIYVDIAGAPSQALTALQAFPADDDTLDVDDVKLISYVEGNPRVLAITGFDFQLFSEGDLETPLAEMIDLGPSDEPNDSLAAIFAEWNVDVSLAINKTYSWRSRARNGESVGEWTLMRGFYVNSLPKSFSLDQNYPNPFNPSTYISFEIPKETDATITIFNSLGQIVKTISEQRLLPGRHEIIWDGRDDNGNGLASGIYFYRLTAGDFTKTRKMVMIK